MSEQATTLVPSPKFAVPAACQATHLWLPSGKTMPCPRPATTLVLIGCKHEHVDDVRLCDQCASDGFTGTLVCGPCGRAGCDLCRVSPLRTRRMDASA